jgi:hypothetical protein
MYSHGVNAGHGHTKYIIIDDEGRELPPVAFPSLVAHAEGHVVGAIDRIQPIGLEGHGWWWVGEDALLSSQPLSLLSQDRLSDPVMLPALVRKALALHTPAGGATSGLCISGLPASWALETEKCRQLGDRLRAATPFYSGGIRVVAEPLGLVYALALNGDGELTGDPSLRAGTIGVVDVGHHTIDLAVVKQLKVVPSSLATWDVGTGRPLKEIRSRLSATFERDLTLYETDLAVRFQSLRVAGVARPLPLHWDQPLQYWAEGVTRRLVEEWGSAAQLDAIVVGGGGAELEILSSAILRRFTNATIANDPQLAIARGYARFARRLVKEKLAQAQGLAR